MSPGIYSTQDRMESDSVRKQFEPDDGLDPSEVQSPTSVVTYELLQTLLLEQQELSAAEQFSNLHDAAARHGSEPSQAKYYQRLMPTTTPAEGQQYAFEVDLDRCSGCKACVSACHSLNGLDENETWRDVGLLIGGTSSLPIMQHVTTACHHCIEPGCMKGCPVNAYEKDPVTGIVKHLDDQCIGCQYCTLACPYDVPKYHHEKGIVRKCDMCSDRLAIGEAPACVQACPHEAISIKIVDVEQVIENAEADPFLPAAPDPQHTLPTTHFKTSRVFPRNTLPADYYNVNPQHPHIPLIVMLVLTQLSVGAFFVGLMMDQFLPPGSLQTFHKLHATCALGFGLLALGASTMHLGRPMYAFRAFIGLRHSWLSREIVAFGAFAKTAIVYAAACWFFPASSLTGFIGWAVAISGIIGVVCSAMIYAATQREYWSIGRTLAKFLLTSAVLGIAVTWFAIVLFGNFVDSPAARELVRQTGRPLTQILIVVTAAKMLYEFSLLRHLMTRRHSVFKRAARLLVGQLSKSTYARIASGILGGILMPLIVMQAMAKAGR